MSFKLVMLPPAGNRNRDCAARITAAVHEVDISVCTTRPAALRALHRGAEAAYGTMDPELLAAGTELKWLICPAAGPNPAFYFPELVTSPVVVTNMRGIYSDHIGEHIMAFVMAFSRGFHRLLPEQFKGNWTTDPERRKAVYLPEATALIVGTGGIGAATAAHCKHFGMRVVGIDPRCPEPPAGVDELYPPEALDAHLGNADFVIVTAPQTPKTQNLFDRERLAMMKSSAFLINIGRGTTVDLAALDNALRNGTIGGAALDVFSEEPLPPDHPLWTAPNFLMTPHCAGTGPYLEDRRIDLIIENCRRFARREGLLNVVDKENWF